MEMTNKDLLQKLVDSGMRMRYGLNPNDLVIRKIKWEMDHIVKAGYEDYYYVAHFLFNYAKKIHINIWARGAVPSSIICYCLGLTEVDPVRYGLRSERFVNDNLPLFQYDIESSYFDEFMKHLGSTLEIISDEFDITDMRNCLLGDIKPSDYLSRKSNQTLPNDLEDEVARYALKSQNTKDLFNCYVQRKEGHEKWEQTGINQLDEILAPTYGILAYQEQMLEILRQLFHVKAIDSEHIRLFIQRGEAEHIKACKAELFSNLKDLSSEEAEKIWRVLISNPHAFLKAHAVSQIIEKYTFERKEDVVRKMNRYRVFYEGLATYVDTKGKCGFINEEGKLMIPCRWKNAFSFSEGLAKVVNYKGKFGFVDKSGKLVIPCQWKNAYSFYEGLAGVMDENGKWGFIDKSGNLAIPCQWSNILWLFEGKKGKIKVQRVIGEGWSDIDIYEEPWKNEMTGKITN